MAEQVEIAPHVLARAATSSGYDGVFSSLIGGGESYAVTPRKRFV